MTNTPQRATVVVGVDGTAGSGAAIRLAAQEARYREAALVAVMAYSEPPLGAPAARPMATLRTAEDQRIAAETALQDAVADALGGRADEVELQALPGLAGRNLVDAARKADAQLLVLASRGSAARLLGAVSQYVLRRAPCPVLVVSAAAQAA